MKHLLQRTVAICLVLGMLLSALPVSYGARTSVLTEESKAIPSDSLLAIYHPGSSVAVTTEIVSYTNGLGITKEQLLPAMVTLTEEGLSTDADNVALFKITTNENGITTFQMEDGRYLYADAENVRFADEPGTYTEFVLEETVDGYYIRLANCTYVNSFGEEQAQYLEYYKNAFSVYSMGTNTEMYVFAFHPVKGTCVHIWNEGTLTTSATCTLEGTMVYTCTLCGFAETQPIPAMGHSWDSGSVSLAATCGSKGEVTYTCSLCAEVKTEPIPATGKHRYQNDICSVCGVAEEINNAKYVLSDELKDGDSVIIVCAAKNIALSGIYGTYYNNPIPINVFNGTIENPSHEIIWTVNEVDGGFSFSYEGQTIGLEDQFSNMSLGGKYNIWKKLDAETKDASYLFNEDRGVYMEYYEAKGYWSTYRTVSDESLYALNFYVASGLCEHLWNEGTLTTSATCITEGAMLYTCSLCESTKIEVIPASGHSWNEGEISTAPNCTEEGIRTYTCTVCGDIKAESIPPVGHRISGWSLSVIPTCTEAGRRVWTCDICGTETASEEVPPNGHSFAHHICIYCDAEEVVEGQCGPELFWSLQLNSGLLSIRGKGDMYSFMDVPPWDSYHSRIFRVQLTEEITSIGSYAFDNCSLLEEIEIPASVTRIEEGAFWMCSSLRAVTVRNGQCSLPEKLFALTDLENLRLYGQLNSALEEYAEAEGLRFLPACDCIGGRGVMVEQIQATCTAAEAISYYCDLCGFKAEKEGQPPLEHQYSYVCDGMSHLAYCSCGERRWEGHSFTDGRCICGLDQNIRLQHTLNLASDISISYAVKQELLQGYDSFYLKCSVPSYEGNQFLGMRSLTIQPVERGSYYYFTLEGLTAVNMNDVIEASLHMEKDGQLCFSSKDSYSIATYAYAQLGKEAAGQKLKVLCANLLRYGGATQIYKGYRTDALADAGLTAEHRSYLTNLDAVTFGNNNTILDDLSAPQVKWIGKSLDLQSKVGVKFVVGVPMLTRSEGPLTLHVSYKNIEGELVTVILDDGEFYDEDKGYFAFTFDGLMAAELRTPLTVSAYKNGEQVSQSLIYSPDTYGNGKTGTLLTLCQALFAYSDAAKAYFTS